MISMKICFQCSHVWKPLCRDEVCGRVASCSWMKFSHWRKSEYVWNEDFPLYVVLQGWRRKRERERIKGLRQLCNRRRFVAWRWRDLQIQRPWTASGPSPHAFPPLHGTAALGAGWVQGESGTRDEEEAEWKIACCLWGTTRFAVKSESLTLLIWL